MKKYTELFSKIKNEGQRFRDDNVLIIDSMNIFIRSFSVVKTINSKGQHTGGMVGYLRSLGFLTRTLNPTRIICVFDGRGGSSSRKLQNPEYKSNRDQIQVTNWGMYDDLKQERLSMYNQVERLRDYLECLPVTVVTVDKAEADDTISYIAQQLSNKGTKCTIVSSDQDFFQLVDDNISLYQPIKKATITVDNASLVSAIHPTNFLVAKALLGDSSDNLRGVKRLGEKTLLKEIPEFMLPKKLHLQEVYDIACIKVEEVKHKAVYDNIVNDWDMVCSNYKIMNIEQPRVSEADIENIKNTLSETTPRLMRTYFLKYLEEDLITGITKNTDNWLDTFLYLTSIPDK